MEQLSQEARKAEKLQHDTDSMIKYLLNKYKSILSIYLCGGYGRNEGTWVHYNDKTIGTYNDYDLTIVTSYPAEFCDIEQTRKELANLVKIHWVDINIMTKEQLQKQKITIKNVDFMQASMLLYGEDCISSLKELNPRRIGLYDIEKLYFTRLWCFLGSFKGTFCDLNCEDSLFFRNQMAKAILATVDVELIKKHKYTSSYVTRVKMIKHISKDKEYIELSNWALNEKLKPSMYPISACEMKCLYDKAYDYYIKVFETGFSALSWSVSNPNLTKWLFGLQPRHQARIVFNKVIRKTDNYNKYINVNILQNFVFRAYSYGEINVDMLNRAKKMARIYKPQITDDCDWYELKNIVADIRNGD